MPTCTVYHAWSYCVHALELLYFARLCFTFPSPTYKHCSCIQHVLVLVQLYKILFCSFKSAFIRLISIPGMAGSATPESTQKLLSTTGYSMSGFLGNLTIGSFKPIPFIGHHAWLLVSVHPKKVVLNNTIQGTQQFVTPQI